LCQTWEADEGKERAASEMADLLYHAMVLLNVQVRPSRPSCCFMFRQSVSRLVVG
jgi:hypothetical protein